MWSKNARVYIFCLTSKGNFHILSVFLNYFTTVLHTVDESCSTEFLWKGWRRNSSVNQYNLAPGFGILCIFSNWTSVPLGMLLISSTFFFNIFLDRRIIIILLLLYRAFWYLWCMNFMYNNYLTFSENVSSYINAWFCIILHFQKTVVFKQSVSFLQF